jgi:hypothetical protein
VDVISKAMSIGIVMHQDETNEEKKKGCSAGAGYGD